MSDEEWQRLQRSLLEICSSIEETLGRIDWPARPIWDRWSGAADRVPNDIQ